MPEEGALRRRYRRLLPAQEAELSALWEAGAITPEDLSARFGMSRRGVQAALARLGSKKGAAASAVAVAVHKRVLAEAVPEHADLAARIRETGLFLSERFPSGSSGDAGRQ